MDMADKASRRGAVDLGVILMVVALAVIAGFIYWLSGQAANERALEIKEDSTAMADTVDTSPSGAKAIVAADIQTDATPLLGQLVRIADIRVASTLGRQGFWLDLPSSPFLVSFTPALVADSTRVTPQSTVSVTGTVRAMNDSTAAAWVAAGTISEGDQLVASFATAYIEATRIEVSTRAPAGN
jgi:hypothetical protein